MAYDTQNYGFTSLLKNRMRFLNPFCVFSFLILNRFVTVFARQYSADYFNSGIICAFFRIDITPMLSKY